MFKALLLENQDGKTVPTLTRLDESQLPAGEVRVAAVSGLSNVRALMEAIDHGRADYDFVEVMACPGGCVCGGGQPLMPPLMEEAESRANSLYAKLRRRLSAIEND